MRKPFFLSVIGLILLTLSGFVTPPQGYQVGDKAMLFKLKNVDGKMVALGDASATKGYIVVFTCNTCPVAQADENRMMARDHQYAAKGYPVIAINANDGTLSPGDSFDEMKKRSASKGYAFPYLLDETQEVAKTYGARSTPTVYVVKRTGSDFIVSYIGAIDNNRDNPSEAGEKYVQKAVDALLAGKPVETPTVKAIGCGIRWKQA